MGNFVNLICAMPKNCSRNVVGSGLNDLDSGSKQRHINMLLQKITVLQKIAVNSRLVLVRLIQIWRQNNLKGHRLLQKIAVKVL